MKAFLKFVAMLTLSMTMATTVNAQTLPGSGKTVRYAQSDSFGGNYVVAQIVSKAFKMLGYDVKLSTMNTTLFFQAVAQGDVDLATDVNFPQREPGFRAVADQAMVVGSGLIAGDGINGYLIDKKTALAYNITSLEQLKDPKIAALFGKDGKAELISCDPGWSCGDVVDYQLDKFGLKQTVKSVRGKYEALMVEAVTKVKSGKPAFFYAWSPSWVTNALVPGVDVVWLPTPTDALPPNVPNTGVSSGQKRRGMRGRRQPLPHGDGIMELGIRRQQGVHRCKSGRQGAHRTNSLSGPHLVALGSNHQQGRRIAGAGLETLRRVGRGEQGRTGPMGRQREKSSLTEDTYEQ